MVGCGPLRIVQLSCALQVSYETLAGIIEMSTELRHNFAAKRATITPQWEYVGDQGFIMHIPCLSLPAASSFALSASTTVAGSSHTLTTQHELPPASVWVSLGNAGRVATAAAWTALAAARTHLIWQPPAGTCHRPSNQQALDAPQANRRSVTPTSVAAWQVRAWPEHLEKHQWKWKLGL